VRVTAVEVFPIDIPFRVKFSHSLKERVSSESIIVRVTLDSGHTGYGEGLPREYVTGETVASAAEVICSKVMPVLLSRAFSSPQDIVQFVSHLSHQVPACAGAAQCAVELACLDAAGNAAGVSVSEFIGGRKREKVYYTGVIGAGSVAKVIKYGLIYRLGGFKFVKLKVGRPDDIERIKALRQVVGYGVDIRVDANCAWTLAEAQRVIAQMRQLGVKAVEQPLPAADIEGLKKLTRETGVIISVDESLATVADAQLLAREHACSMFNIRISKCGGLFNSLRIYDIARRNGIKCQLGCQVGETSILSAAGRHLALLWDDVEYVEGSFGTLLLRQDIVRKKVMFGYRGAGRTIPGPGLGIQSIDATLVK